MIKLPKFRINILFLLTIILFVIALCGPCYLTYGRRPENYQGVLLLIIGWMGVLDGAYGIAWLANPLFITSVILGFFNKKLAKIFGVCALCFALEFLLVHNVLVDESGRRAAVTQYFYGYWCWVSCMVVNILNTIIKR